LQWHGRGGEGKGKERGEKRKVVKGREIGMHDKITPKCSTFVIMGTPLACHTFLGDVRLMA